MRWISFLILTLSLCLANGATENDLILRDSAKDLKLKKLFQNQDNRLAQRSPFNLLFDIQRDSGTCQEK